MNSTSQKPTLQPYSSSNTVISAAEVERLRERVRKLEAALEKSQAMFEDTMADVFASVPARASMLESGSIQQPFHGDCSLVVNFGRRFVSVPRVSAWIIVKSPPKPLPPRQQQQQQQQDCTQVESVFGGGGYRGSSSSARTTYNIEDMPGTEVFKVVPSCIKTFSSKGHNYVSFTIPLDITAAVDSAERKDRSVLYWVAWEPQAINPHVTAIIKKIFSAGPGLSKQVNN